MPPPCDHGGNSKRDLRCSAKGGGFTTRHRAVPVEPDAMRVARPVRRRLAGAIPLTRGQSRRSIRYQLFFVYIHEIGRQGHAPVQRNSAALGSCRLKWVTRCFTAKSLRRGSVPSHWDRSTSAGVGSLRPGDRRNRALPARRSVQTTDGEKLNHERPARACR